MLPKIIYQDKDLIVLDKPAGWIVNSASTTGDNPVIQDWIKSMDYPLAKDNLNRSGIVHRLDKDTSGLLIVAKNINSFAYLQKLFKERKIKKKYLALLHGILKPETGEISAPVGRLPWNRRRFGILPGGREAKTGYKVVKYYGFDKDKYSLVEFLPQTGRTHQIRIHAKYLGHPIVSDSFYAGRKTSRNDRSWCPRLFLHASEITFINLKQKVLKMESPLAADLQAALDKITII